MINWTRVGMPLPAGKTNINQGTLTINNLSPADNGFYDCVATNVMGTKKKRINLAVQVHRSGLYWRHRLTLYIPDAINGCFGNWALIQVCIKSAIYICLSKKRELLWQLPNGNWAFGICISLILHLFRPLNFCKTSAINFSWLLQSLKRYWKQSLLQYSGLLGAKGFYYWRDANGELGINAFNMEFTNVQCFAWMWPPNNRFP